MEDLVSDYYSVCLIHMHESVYKFEIFNSKCDLHLLLFCKSGYFIILFSSNILFVNGRLAYIYFVIIYTKQLVQEWLTSLESKLFSQVKVGLLFIST